MPRAKKKAPVVPYNTGNNEKVAATQPGGQPYGARTEQQTALAAVPLAGPSSGPAPADAAPPDAAAPPDNSALLQAAQQYQMSGTGLTDPSANVGEPVTAGLASGPGAGPGALNMPDPTQLDVQSWRTYLPTLEYLASLPSSTASTRNFVRRLRSSMPPAAP